MINFPTNQLLLTTDYIVQLCLLKTQFAPLTFEVVLAHQMFSHKPEREKNKTLDISQ